MPKKQAKNPFWFFMVEWKMLEEQKGRTFPNGFRDVQADPQCNEAWRALTPAQKVPYTRKAKDSKNDFCKDKKTSTGESIQLIKEEEQRKQDFKLTMDAHISYTVSTAKQYNALPALNFVFIHMNWYYMREPDNGPVDFCPAEFAIGEFSVEDGLTRYYHEIIKTDLHLGYTREAMETSEKTHKLHWELENGEGDWAIIYHKMMHFLERLEVNGDLPPIYTSNKYMHILPSLLRRITAGVGKTPDIFHVYSLESLFGHMLRAVTDFASSNIVAVLAETQLGKELFAYTPNIECDYHKTLEGTGQYCSLSVIRQWAFEFCEQCCRGLGVDMIPGIHCPDTDGISSGHNTFSGSLHSLISDRSISVLSATGVSEQHRIAVSERNRGEEARRRKERGTVEIIDHSLLNKEKYVPKPEPAPIAVPIPSPAPSIRAPTTASQALMGVSRDVPIFNGENFPAIGGRGTPIKKTGTRRMEGPIWSHRGRKNSDSD